MISNVTYGCGFTDLFSCVPLARMQYSAQTLLMVLSENPRAPPFVFIQIADTLRVFVTSILNIWLYKDALCHDDSEFAQETVLTGMTSQGFSIGFSGEAKITPLCYPFFGLPMVKAKKEVVFPFPNYYFAKRERCIGNSLFSFGYFDTIHKNKTRHKVMYFMYSLLQLQIGKTIKYDPLFRIPNSNN